MSILHCEFLGIVSDKSRFVYEAHTVVTQLHNVGRDRWLHGERRSTEGRTLNSTKNYIEYVHIGEYVHATYKKKQLASFT